MGEISSVKQVSGSFILIGPGNGSIELEEGYWIFECWGASGGDSFHTGIEKSFPGGHGGYSIGVYHLNNKNTVFLSAGGQGSSNSTGLKEHVPGGFNGGGSGYIGSSGWPVGSGGGSSDIRVGGQEIEHRVIVAGGGGGAGVSNNNLQIGQFGGNGGGLEGLEGGGYGANYDSNGGKGGNQVSGGAGGNPNGTQLGEDGTIFQGGKGSKNANTASSAGGGGGGYFGGGGGTSCGGGGGSGYIGGVFTALGVKSRSYSGNSVFSSPFLYKEQGHTGDGIVKITNIKYIFIPTCEERYGFINYIFFSIITIFDTHPS